ncbi:MAG: hypothetical protein ACOX43_08485 [Bacilli bacterium]
MTKLSRKLLLSVLTVAFALITLGATTFAWFTLSTKAEIEAFDVEVTSGAGIEISADGSNYSNYISAQQIYSAITSSNSSTILDHVTSKDGLSFTTIDYEGELSFNKVANSGWAEFDLWFRSPEANVEVYMLNNTNVTSTGVKWISDANFQIRQLPIYWMLDHKELFMEQMLLEFLQQKTNSHHMMKVFNIVMELQPIYLNLVALQETKD